MTIAVPTNMPLIAIYFCGGTGYNLGAKFMASIQNNSILQETTKVYFVDTSTSNNKPFNTPENTAVLGSGQGSGSFRGENAKPIREYMSQLLKDFKPGVFNILVGSASGGSGSTIINEIHRELTIREQNVVNLLTGTRSSMANTKNLHKTLQSFALVTERTARPTLINLRLQEPGETRDNVDAMILNNLVLLSLLFSGKDDKMDITDLSHLLNYPKVTSYKESVVGLEMFIDTVMPAKNETVYAVGTLARGGSVTDIDPPPHYQVVGFVDESIADIFKGVSVIHWAVIGNCFNTLMKNLQETVDTYEKEAREHRTQSLASSLKDHDDDIVV